MAQMCNIFKINNFISKQASKLELIFTEGKQR